MDKKPLGLMCPFRSKIELRAAERIASVLVQHGVRRGLANLVARAIVLDEIHPTSMGLDLLGVDGHVANTSEWQALMNHLYG